jgi:hypothetical protein
MIGQSPQDAPTDEATGTPGEARPLDTTSPPSPGSPPQAVPTEWGGRDGPEPTRYGDWEKNGRCIDF